MWGGHVNIEIVTFLCKIPWEDQIKRTPLKRHSVVIIRIFIWAWNSNILSILWLWVRCNIVNVFLCGIFFVKGQVGWKNYANIKAFIEQEAPKTLYSLIYIFTSNKHHCLYNNLETISNLEICLSYSNTQGKIYV